jgi:hypothetical protein
MDCFDIKNCIRFEDKFEDKTYFWDAATKSVVELGMQRIDIKDCPERVIEALLIAANRREGVSL